MRVAAATADPQVPAVHVALVGDSTFVRRGVRELLSRDERVQLAFEASGLGATDATLLNSQNGAAGVAPNVIVTHAIDTDGASVEIVRRVHARFPLAAIVALVLTDDPLATQRALKAGAVGVVLIDRADVELSVAVAAAADRQRYLSARIQRRLNTLHASLQDDKLTVREMEVLWLIARGFTSAEIARRLWLSTRTIEAHRARVSRKLGAKRRADLVRYALERHLLRV